MTATTMTATNHDHDGHNHDGHKPRRPQTMTMTATTMTATRLAMHVDELWETRVGDAERLRGDADTVYSVAVIVVIVCGRH